MLEKIYSNLYLNSFYCFKFFSNYYLLWAWLLSQSNDIFISLVSERNCFIYNYLNNTLKMYLRDFFILNLIKRLICLILAIFALHTQFTWILFFLILWLWKSATYIFLLLTFLEIYHDLFWCMSCWLICLNKT